MRTSTAGTLDGPSIDWHIRRIRRCPPLPGPVARLTFRGRTNAREMRADLGETGPKLYADWRALNPRGGSETAFLEQHEGVVRTP